MRFKVDGVTASQNPWDRAHWRSRSEDRKYWYYSILSEVGRVDRVECQRRLHICRLSKRLIDDQNVPSGCKYIVDALVEYGHLYDDSRRWARVTFDQRKCNPVESPHMDIIITDWDGTSP